MSGETITNAMKPMHDRSNGLAADLPVMESIRNIKTLCFICFLTAELPEKDARRFLKERFEIVQSEIIPTRKTPLITDEPIIWRYFVAPLKSLRRLCSWMKRNMCTYSHEDQYGDAELMSFPAAKTWELSKQWDTRKTSVFSIN